MAYRNQLPTNDFGRFDVGTHWRASTHFGDDGAQSEQTRHAWIPFSGGAQPEQPSSSHSDYGLTDTFALFQHMGVDFLPLIYQIALGQLGAGGQADICQAIIDVQTSFAFKPYGTLRGQRAFKFRDLIDEIMALTHPLIKNHPHIVRLEGFNLDIEGDHDISLILVFEKTHMDDLNHFITSGIWTDISVAERLSICADIGIAVRDMHSNGIIHGDLKPGNVLVFQDANGKYIGKVADFGASAGLHDANKLVKMPKSFPWNAPEHCHRPVPLLEARKMDIYSFGILCFWILFEKSGSTSSFSNIANSRNEQYQGFESLIAAHRDGIGLLSLALSLIEEEESSLDSDTMTRLANFFKASLNHNAEHRVDDISSLMPLLAPGREILPVEVIRHGSIPELKSFEISSCIYQLYEADFRLRFSIVEELKSLLSGQTTAYFHAPSENVALQLALCYQLGCGVVRDIEIAREYLDDYKVPEKDFHDRLKSIEGASDLFYQEGLFKSIYISSHMLLSQAKYYRRENQLDTAVKIYSKDINDLKAALGTMHPLTIIPTSQLAWILKDIDRLQEAEALDLQNVSLLGGDSDSTSKLFEPALPSMMNLASIYKLQANWEKSEELNLKILSWLKQGKYSNHPVVLTVSINLATTYRSQGRLEEAENLVREVAEKRMTSLGINHVDTIASMTTLSDTLCEMGKWTEAEILQKKVVAKSKVVLGLDHPLTIIWMSNLAAIYRKLGRYHESLELMLTAMSNAQKILGTYHPDSLTYTAQAAWLMGVTGQIQHAQKLLTHVVTARQEVLGPDHPSLLASMNDLASVHRLQGNFDEAERLELQVIEKNERILGNDHTNTLLSQGNLATVYRKQKRLKEAEKLERQVLAVTIQRFGDRSPDSLWSISNLGATLYDLGQYDEAEKHFVHVVECRSRLLGPKNLSTLIATGNLSMTYQMQRKFEQAVELESQVLQACTEVLGEYHQDTLTSMNNLAMNLRGLGLHDKAVELMNECIHKKEKTLGVDHELTKVSQKILGNWFTKPAFSREKLLDWCSQFSTTISKQIDPLYRDETAMQRLKTILSDLLKAFFRRLAYAAKTQEDYDFANHLLDKYAELISYEIQHKLSQFSDPAEHIDVSAPSVEERTAQWHPGLNYDEPQTSMDISEDTTSNPSLLLPADDLPKQGIYEAASQEANRSWNYDNSYIKLELQLSSPKLNILYTIRDQITTLFSRHRQIDKNPFQLAEKIAFEIECDPISLLNNHHFEGANSFGSTISKLVTLTSDGKDIQALTCEQYMKQTWPHDGQRLLSLLTQIVESGKGVVQFDKGSIEGWIADSKVCILATGMFEMIVETAEQLAWLGCVLRSSPVPNVIFNCTPSIKSICYMSFRKTSFEEKSKAGFYCSIEYSIQAATFAPEIGSCWHKLFLFTVIALNFPILQRADFVHGLEMQLSTILALCQAQHIGNLHSEIMIKGFSCICTLSDRRPGWSVWHLSGDPDGPHIFPVHKRGEPQFQELSAYSIIGDRHFVGWCTELDYKAGALDGEYKIGHSGTRRALAGHLLQGKQLRRGLRYRHEEIYITNDKDNPRRNVHQTYIQDLQWLHSKTIILWDMSSERGWLVNGTSALLHLVLASIEKDERGPFSSTCCFDRLSITKLGRRAEDMAAKILSDEQNLNLVISRHGEEKTLLRERIEDLLYILRSMIEQQILALSVTNRNLVELEGWDFMDIANVSIDPFFPRSTAPTRDCRGWMQLLQDTCAITLYGRNFGDIIQSKMPDQCTFWRSLPSSKSYLAASMYDLTQIMEIQGDPYANPKRLSANTIWPIIPNTFDSCDCNGNSSEEHSDMAQILVPVPFFRDQFQSTGLYYDFPESGAVIFERVESIEQHDEPYLSKALLNDPSSTSLSQRYQARDNGRGKSLSHSITSDCSYLDYEEYLVAIICALPKELLAVRLLFDKRYPDIPVDTNDTNHYALGHISGHDIVAACLPSGIYGNSSAATVASHLKRSFPNVCVCLLVGIGGGVPSAKHDIRLGDVVVSHPIGSLTGVVKYDFGKLEAEDVFERTGMLQPPPQRLLTAISKLRSEPDSTAQLLQNHLKEITEQKPEYARPSSGLDRLFVTDYSHAGPDSSCTSCNGPTVQRMPRTLDLPNIYYGIVASGDQVMKNAQVRDRIGNKYGALCFEMEAAGITNVMPCLAIRGICDYSDSHKQDAWQEYACASAAACAKLLLSHVRAFKSGAVYT